MKKNPSNTNKELPVAYVAEGSINCPDCGSKHVVIANTHIFEFSDEENGFCIVGYRCKDCNCKFSARIHFRYQITYADDFRILN